MAIQNQQARNQSGETALKALYAATNADQLLEAIRMIPGAPPNIAGRFEEQPNEVIGTIRCHNLIALVKHGWVGGPAQRPDLCSGPPLQALSVQPGCRSWWGLRDPPAAPAKSLRSWPRSTSRAMSSPETVLLRVLIP